VVALQVVALRRRSNSCMGARRKMADRGGLG
jgi:hypothetical protein